MSADPISRYSPPDYGPDTEPEDAIKFVAQMARVLELLLKGGEYSHLEMCKALNLPPSTRLDSRARALRAPKNGAWVVECRRSPDGIYRYSIKGPKEQAND